MLISFEVENYGCFYDRQEISFVASTSKKEKNNDCLIESPGVKNHKLLPAMLVYGANASGKTQLIKAFVATIKTILHSHTLGIGKKKIPTRKPFQLNKEAANKPTTFEVHFVMDNIHYGYGFKFLEKEIIEEWLVSYPYSTPRVLFEREGQNFSFGRHLKGQNRVIGKTTRANSLFLSAAAQNNHELLGSVYSFFREILVESSLGINSIHVESEIAADDDTTLNEDVFEFFRNINSGIIGHHFVEREIPEKERVIANRINHAIETILEEAQEDYVFVVPPEKQRVLELEHSGLDNTHFPLTLESAGTLRLLSALPKIFNTLKEGGVILFDEFDVGLHTQAAEEILKLFCDKESNPHGAQLLATTHNTNLLGLEFLRRDQVWFTEKEYHGATRLYPLSDFKIRISDNLERGYLQGRFGATPL